MRGCGVGGTAAEGKGAGQWIKDLSVVEEEDEVWWW